MVRAAERYLADQSGQPFGQAYAPKESNYAWGSNSAILNNLQVISSLFNLQARAVRDPRLLEILKECQNRVRAMALVHEKLYRSRDLARIAFAEYVRSLA